MLAHRWDKCHPLIGQKAPMIRRHVARPNKFKWAGPTKGPHDFADHNGTARLKAHVISPTIMGQPS